MKNFTIQGKLKIAFYASLIFAGIMLCIMYVNMRKTAAESKKAAEALKIITSLENITVRTKNLDEKLHVLEVAKKETIILAYDSIMPKIKLEQKKLSDITKTDNLKTDITDFNKLVDIKTNAFERTYRIVEALKKDTIINSALADNFKTYLQNISTKKNEITIKQIDILATTNTDRESYAKKLAWILFTLAIAFAFILFNGYILVMQDFKKSAIVNETLAYNSNLLSNISDAIISTDENYAIKSWNKFAEALYGFNEKEVIGKPISDIIGLSDIDKDLFLKISEEKKIWKGEMVHKHKTGIPIHVEVSTSAIYNDKNKLVGGIGVIHDVTERVKLENNLKVLSEKLKQEVDLKSSNLNDFFERIADAFFILDNDWNYTYLNKRSLIMHGKEAHELIGKNIWEAYPELVGSSFYNSLFEARKTQKVSRGEFHYISKDEWFDDLIYPNEEGISVYYTDVTAKKKSDLQLNKAHKRLSSHLTNTPLAVLEFDSDLKILHWSKKAAEMFGWTAEEIEQECIQMDRLVHKDDLISFYQQLHKHAEIEDEESVISNRGVTKSGNIIYCDWYNSFLKDENNSSGVMLSLIKDVTKTKQTEIELTNTEAKFRSLVEDSIVGVYIRKNDKLLYVNPRFEEIFGYTAKELYESDIDTFDLVNKEDRSHILNTRKALAEQNNKSLNYEFRGIHKSGESFYAEVFGNVTQLDGEEVVIGTVIDITERKEAAEKIKLSEEALKKTNERFEFVAKATNDAVWDWDMEANKLTGNETFFKHFNLPPNSELKFEDFLGKVHKDDRERLESNFRVALSKRESLVTEEFRFDDGNGNYKILYDRGYLLYDTNKHAYRMLGAMQDITALKKTERILKSSEEKYKLLFNENPLPMWILSEETGRFIDSNGSATRIYGYTKEEFLSMPIIDLHPENDKDYHSWLAKSEEEKSYLDMNWFHKKKNGEIIRVNIISNRITYEGKNATIALANDVTAQFEADEKLQQSSEAFRDLASRLETIRETERTHMAREIHDELGQQLTGLKMDISWINKKVQSADVAVQERIKDTIQLIDKAVITVRKIATDLRPSILDDLGLIAAMDWHSEDFEKRTEIKSIFRTNVNHILVSPEIATGLFRIFQESLTNVSRHSGASQVNSNFYFEDNKITLMIEDNGKGFKDEEIVKKKTLGLLGMKERVMLIKGTYEIKGNEGIGASVIINVPLN
jgi:PAS domain S-box-containing protein